jgi:predicted DNA-binding transcriptional regulator AlpA
MNPTRATLERAHPRVARGQKHSTLNIFERPVISADEAFGILGIDRGTGYKAIREGTFPVPVLHIGRLIRIPTVGLLRLLMLDDAPPGVERKED